MSQASFCPATFVHHTVKLSDVHLHYVEAGKGVPVVLVHGWPDLWFGWRKIIGPLASAGFRVIVPDMKGFGQSSAPLEVEKYSLKSLATDLVELLDHLKIERAIFCGHDHGGSIVWRVAMHFPSRVIAVASVCTPYTPPHQKYVSIQEIAKLWPSFKYQVYFNSGEAPVKEFESNIPRFFQYFLRGASEGSPSAKFTLATETGPVLPNQDANIPDMLSKEEFDYYVDNFKKSGFRASLNYYKTHKINFEDEKHCSPYIQVPCLMITAGKDFVLTPAMTKHMEKWIPHLSRGHVANGNHWLLQEFPSEVTTILLQWLTKINKSKL